MAQVPSLDQFNRVVVKVGPSLLVDSSRGAVKEAWLEALVADIAALNRRGANVMVVSSGAIALGRTVAGLPKGALKLEDSQASAAIGQIALSSAWSQALQVHAIVAGQVLVTLQDTEERRRYLNARATLGRLIAMRAIPIINENDLARLRARLRGGELGLVALAIGVGVLAGLCVSAMTSIVDFAHVVIYGIPFDVRLSAAERVPPIAAFVAPTLAGLALGSIDAWRARKKLRPAVDPVEANALRGGRMSLNESLLVAAQTVVSNGCGASVGLEAGYAQIGAGVASRLGLDLHLRRQDLRMLVGCGAGGAIAAAFGAPLTGAFYAFELIIGAYSLANAGPVFAASLVAVLTTKAIVGAPYVINALEVSSLTFAHYGALVGLGLVAAALGVGAMRAAALIERAFHAAVPSRVLRPVAGGLMLGAMALYTPQVLGAGHGALGLDFYWPLSATELAILISLKLFASLVSLASGFRGGLFFASLFVGSLLGKLYSIGVDALFPSLGLDTIACMLVGMGALSTAIVGGPLTMTFLVLESTGDLGLAGGVLTASIATTLAVRATFGYSFTTWRLHLRGETIRGGQDVGWLRDLTVGKMMVSSPSIFLAEGSVRAFREAYPLGSANVVVVVGEDGRYHGLIHVAEAHARALKDGDDGGPVGLIAHLPATTLHPDDNIRAALDLFGEAQTDTLAVTERESGHVLGTLAEAFAARRYAQETNVAMKGVLGGG